MDRAVYEESFVDEKAELLPQRVTYETQRGQDTRKRRFRPGVILAVIIWLWWSVYAIPSLLFGGDNGVGEDSGELTFDEVLRTNILHGL